MTRQQKLFEAIKVRQKRSKNDGRLKIKSHQKTKGEKE